MREYIFLALALALIFFAVLRVVYLIGHAARGGDFTTVGIIAQPLYIGAAVALALWLLRLAGVGS